jgi:hypothetical protein
MTVSAVNAEKLNVCESDWPPYQIVRGMGMLGQTDDFNLHRETLETCIFGIKKEKYDMTFFTLFEFVTTQHESECAVIAALDYSTGGDAIVLRDEIQSASELKGKNLGLQTDTLSLQLLYLYLTKNKMTLDDLKLVHIGVENVSKAFMTNPSLAGIVGWSPFTDEAVRNGGKLVASSRDFPEKIIDVMAVRRNSLQKYRSVYKDFLKKWFVAVHDPAVLEKTAEYNKISAEEFKKLLECAHIYPDVASSLQAFPKMRDASQELQEFFKTKPPNIPHTAARLFGKPPLNSDSWFDDSLLKELARE